MAMLRDELVVIEGYPSSPHGNSDLVDGFPPALFGGNFKGLLRCRSGCDCRNLEPGERWASSPRLAGEINRSERSNPGRQEAAEARTDPR